MQKITLSSEEEEKQRCVWLKDKYGLSWQIVPSVLVQMLLDKDNEKSNKVMTAMLEMDKIDTAILNQSNDQQ